MNKRELLLHTMNDETATMYGSAIIGALPDDTEITLELLNTALMANKEYPPNFTQNDIEIYSKGFDEAYGILVGLLGFE